MTPESVYTARHSGVSTQAALVWKQFGAMVALKAGERAFCLEALPDVPTKRHKQDVGIFLSLPNSRGRSKPGLWKIAAFCDEAATGQPMQDS
jgi:hypothetical protein